MPFQTGSADARSPALFPRTAASPHPGRRDEIAELSVIIERLQCSVTCEMILSHFFYKVRTYIGNDTEITGKSSAFDRAPRAASASIKTHLLLCSDPRAAARRHRPLRLALCDAPTAAHDARARVEDGIVDGMRNQAGDRLRGL